MFSQVQSASLYVRVVEQIENSILAGDLTPGDKLPSERELAEQFGVSRTVIREAVKALSQRGLVSVERGKGTFIVDNTPQAVRHSLNFVMQGEQEKGTADLVQVRIVLEPGIAAIAAQQATESDIAEMGSAIGIMDEALDDADAFVEADLTFHLTLARATNNNLITMLIDPIVDLLREHRKRIFLVKGAPQRAQIHHKRILKAITDRDAESAHAAMQEHLMQVRDDSDTATDE